MFSDVFAHIESGFNHFRSVIHNPLARVAAISAVNKEVDAAMQLLRTVRNALAPVSLLPPEVLARVFRFLSLDEPPHSGKQNLGWIRVTHVCQLWRQVALDDSSLWARISGVTTNTELVSEMLARARNAPLDINVNLNGATISEVLLMFPPHLSHTRELCFKIVTPFCSDSFRDIYSHEAPALEILELHSLTSPVTFQELGRTTLFKGQAPKLRTLTLSQVFIPWSLIPRGQLTQLDISLHDELSIADDTSFGDLNQLVDLLVNSPGLEVLSLVSCLPSQLTHFPCGQTIRLPRLSRLILSGLSSRISNLLKMLELPSSTILQLLCDSDNTTTYSDHLLLPILSAHYRGPTPMEFKSLRISLSCVGSWLDVTASISVPTSRVPPPLDLECDMSDDDEKFVLYLDGLPEDGCYTDLIEGLCKVLPISNLESLFISAPGKDSSVNWVEIFKRCTKVTTLQVIGRGTSSLVRALATPKVTNTRHGGKLEAAIRESRHPTPAHPARSTTSRAYGPIFPELASLSLKRLDFAEVESSSILFDVIQKGLRQRMVAYDLKTLCIGNSAISVKRAKALQKLVQKFYWDEKETFIDKCGVADSPFCNF